MGVPVYSIGPTSVSVITEHLRNKNGDVFTKEDFQDLANGSYSIFSKSFSSRRETNPFYYYDTKIWLESPK
jgi:hypothetical protein